MLFAAIVALSAVILQIASAMDCPPSSSVQHAGCEVTTTFSNNCDDVKTEINKRVNGQYSEWHDPHNNGTYSISTSEGDKVDLERITGDLKYTDKIRFTFFPSTDGCKVEACSQSQVFSIGDYGTNFCNIHDLYCADSGCYPFQQLKYTESIGKCTDSSSECLLV